MYFYFGNDATILFAPWKVSSWQGYYNDNAFFTQSYCFNPFSPFRFHNVLVIRICDVKWLMITFLSLKSY